MRKIMFALIILSLSFFILGCPQQPAENKDTPAVTNNLSPSSGENELSGKTFSYGTTSFEFGENTVKHSPTDSRAITFDQAQTFAYSFNTEEKKLEFQLAQTWGVLPEAITYDEHIQWVKDQYKSIANSVIAGLDDAIQIPSGGNVDLDKKITSQVTAKAKALLASQEELLADYLTSKYNAVINFDYELTETELTLTESFNNNIADASSMFRYDNSNLYIVLNDYNALYPFTIKIDEESYIGIPSFSNPQAINGTVEVLLYPFMGLPVDPTTLVSKSTAFIANEETTTEIVNELILKDTSPALDSAIDAQIGAQKLKADFEVSTEGSTTLTLTITEVPEYLTGKIEENATFVLNHTPLLAATYSLATE
ncbi:MAG: hypothetical protein J5978_08035 [Spirochaetaceae bacterium]|nr:hypothetical protein [Spirochaetaceae bacterium]